MKKTAKNRNSWPWLLFLVAVLGSATALVARAHASASQPTGATSGAQDQAQTAPQQSQEIPDAPTPQAVPAAPERPPIAHPEDKPVQPAAAAKNPWTGAPTTKPNPSEGEAEQPGPPSMPPVRTAPPGSLPKPNSDNQQKLYTLVVHTNFVQLPVTVKDRDGRMVDGLLPKDFNVVENGTKQQLSFFSSDPFALSVAIVLDLGMPDSAVQKINQTFPALVGAFAPYDEVSLYTYSSTVSQVSDFNAVTQKLSALLNQMKSERGHNNGVPVLSGPMASGPMVNGIPVGSATQPVNTPPKEGHVLNDAILRAALDLSHRERTRRKIIFVISDGREYGSKASYSDVLKLLLSNEIQVKAVAVEAAALPVYNKLEKLHLPHEGYGNLLPKYASATGGAPVFTELSRNAIEETYSQAMSEARNQYTLGYTPQHGDKPPTSAYRSIEVTVDRPDLNIYAKDGYYPAPAAR